MKTTKKMVISALGIALVTISTAFLHLNIGIAFVTLGDVFINVMAILFGPIVGLLSGGFGSFFGDLIAHPSTMFYTLIIKGLEGLVVGLIAKNAKKDGLSFMKKNIFYFISMLVGSIIMVGGYFIAKAFFYGSVETAVVSIMPNVLQALVGLVIALIIVNIISKTNLIKKE